MIEYLKEFNRPIMSVNSGFASRKDETAYTTLVYNLLYLLQYRVRKFYANETVNESNFKHTLLKTVNRCAKMEKSKF